MTLAKATAMCCALRGIEDGVYVATTTQSRPFSKVGAGWQINPGAS